jgi:glycerol-3-phosphate dehydrogenase (NAD(P)+)
MEKMSFKSTLVIGAGNWGTTFASLMANNSQNVSLYLRDHTLLESLRTERENHKYLPGVPLPQSLTLTGNLDSLDQYDLLVLALPTAAIQSWLESALGRISNDGSILNLCKGIEPNSGLRISQLVDKILPKSIHYATLSGPNLAPEIAALKPASAVIASLEPELSRRLQSCISSSNFRVYTNDDLVGVEICGALKNIVAIGAGICHELNLGQNALASLITRGIREISRFGLHFGANPSTFMGLAGVGDLVVTCMSEISRNNRLGRLLAQGFCLEDALQQTSMVVEGVPTCKVVVKIAEENKIYMPISKGIHDILFKGLYPREVIKSLMQGILKEEV